MKTTKGWGSITHSLFCRFLIGIAILLPSFCIYLFIPAMHFRANIETATLTTRLLAASEDSKASSSEPNLFGIVTHLNANIGTASIIIIVAAVLCVEYAFHMLRELTFDTPFEHLVPSVERELMLVGFTAFIFKIVVTVETDLDPDWYHGLEYADILVPLFAFSYCALGLVLIAHTVRQCEVWSKAYHAQLLELLDGYFDVTESCLSTLLMPVFSRKLAEVEFRAFHNIFCHTFKIQRRAFPFNEYVEKVADTFVQNLLGIRLLDWFLVCVLVVLNLVRVKLAIHFYHCSPSDYACQDRSATVLLTLVGAALLAVTAAVAVLSRRIEVRILRAKGVSDRRQLHAYLEHMEGRQDVEEQLARMDGAALKAAVMHAKAQSAQSHLPIHKKKRVEQLAAKLSQAVPEILGPEAHKRQQQQRGVSVHGGISATPSHRMWGQRVRLALRLASQSSRSGMPRPDNRPDASAEATAASSSKLSGDFVQRFDAEAVGDSERSALPLDDVDAPPKPAGPVPATAPASGLFASLSGTSGLGLASLPRSRRKSLLQSFLHTANPPVYDISAHSRDAHIDGAFPLRRPELYFEAVRGLLLFLALYWGLFLSNFLVASRSVAWGMLCATPVCLASVLYVQVVSHASLLLAVHSIDTNALLEVLEQTEASQRLGEQIRDKLLTRLKEMGEPQAELYSLFHELNDSGNGALTREEFAVFMHAIDIHFSRKRWQQIFREIDRNYDDRISFEELFLFLFPHHDVGRALESQRMQRLGRRVKLKARKRARWAGESVKMPSESFRQSSRVVAADEDDDDCSDEGQQRRDNIDNLRMRNLARAEGASSSGSFLHQLLGMGPLSQHFGSSRRSNLGGRRTAASVSVRPSASK